MKERCDSQATRHKSRSDFFTSNLSISSIPMITNEKLSTLLFSIKHIVLSGTKYKKLERSGTSAILIIVPVFILRMFTVLVSIVRTSSLYLLSIN